MPASETNGIAVRCRGVTKTYGKGAASVTALRGIDLDIRQGELLMIVGPSGCGKTTLISIIAAILDRDAGECEVLGRNVMELGRTEKILFRGESIGFVFQVFNLLPSLTALENVAVPLVLNGMPRRLAMAQSRGALDAVGLGARADAYPRELSGGQQQRVAIARALAHNPRLVVCDEPTSNLDHEAGQNMMTILRDVAKSPQRALIIVTHDPRILEYADRIAYMDDGRITEVVEGRHRGRTS